MKNNKSIVMPVAVIRTLIVVMVILICDGKNVMAEGDQLVTAVAIKHEYNDNIKLDSSDTLSDNIDTLSPIIALVRQNEHYIASFDGLLNIYHYQKYDEFDAVDQWYSGILKAYPTERWKYGAEIIAIDDHRPDRDITETGLALNNVRRNRINLGGTASYINSEMMTSVFGIDVYGENYDDPELSDRNEYHMTASLIRDLDAWFKRTKGNLTIGFSRYKFERDFERTETEDDVVTTIKLQDTNDVKYYLLTAGTQSKLTEKIDISMEVGGRYAYSSRDLRSSRTFSQTITIEDPTTIDDSYGNSGIVGNLELTYKTPETRYDFKVSYDLKPVSGSNSLANRTAVRFGSKLRLSEKIIGRLLLQYYRNISDQDDIIKNDISTRTFNAGCNLQWQLTNYLDLTAKYVYTIYDNIENGSTAYRNYATLQIEAHHDWL